MEEASLCSFKHIKPPQRFKIKHKTVKNEDSLSWYPQLLTAKKYIMCPHCEDTKAFSWSDNKQCYRRDGKQ